MTDRSRGWRSEGEKEFHGGLEVGHLLLLSCLSIGSRLVSSMQKAGDIPGDSRAEER